MAILEPAIELTVAIEVISIAFSLTGVSLILGAYLSLLAKKVQPKDQIYLFANALGAFLLMISMTLGALTGNLGAIPLICLELFWGGISVYKLVRVRRKLQRRDLPDPTLAVLGPLSDSKETFESLRGEHRLKAVVSGEYTMPRSEATCIIIASLLRSSWGSSQRK